MKIAELKDGMKRVSIEAQVTEKATPRQVHSRFGEETYSVCDVMIGDDTGKVKLTLWNEQIAQINVGDKIKVDNGYVTSFQGAIQLNVGKFGKLTVI